MLKKGAPEDAKPRPPLDHLDEVRIQGLRATGMLEPDTTKKVGIRKYCGIQMIGMINVNEPCSFRCFFQSAVDPRYFEHLPDWSRYPKNMPAALPCFKPLARAPLFKRESMACTAKEQ